MDLYLYPQRYINPAFINALAPPERSRAPDQDRAASRGAANAKPVDLKPDEPDWRTARVAAFNGV